MQTVAFFDCERFNNMKNYFKNTMELFDRYNQVIDKIKTSQLATTEDEDEFLANFSLYLAHALIKDYGMGAVSREELSKCAMIIGDVID